MRDDLRPDLTRTVKDTLNQRVLFVDPSTRAQLLRNERGWVHPLSGNLVAPVVDGLPRFQKDTETYADSFGWQWQKWDRLHRMSQNPRFNLHQMLAERSRLDEVPTQGRTVLECGCGAGGDTEFLLGYPFAEVHAFDLTRAVDVVARDLDDPRLVLSQASIYEMPYADGAFDVVYCHRVLQHTPDPEAALRTICRKVKPGGILFAHSYRQTLLNALTWKYRYRWLTTRLDPERVHAFVERYGDRLHELCERLSRRRWGYAMVRALAPFHYLPPGMYPTQMTRGELIELEKLITFDALTPTFDRPMSSKHFRRIIESEGFEILNFHATRVSVVYATARRKSPPATR